MQSVEATVGEVLREANAGAARYEVIATVTRRPGKGQPAECRATSLDYPFRSRESASYEAQALHDRLRGEAGVMAVVTQVMAFGSADGEAVEWQAVWPEVP